MLILVLSAQVGPRFQLPAGAKVIETADVTRYSKGHKPRSLVLWMEDPKLVEGSESEDCASPVWGARYWDGPAWVSVVNPSTSEIMQSVKVAGDRDPNLHLQLPAWSFASSQYYLVPKPDRDGKGIPELLHLQDFTGDGRP